MGAIDFELASSFLNNRRQDIQNKDKMTNLFMGTPKTLFDLGGDIQMHGGDYTSGLTHIDAGNSHEMNPYDGVQLGTDPEGTPNLVEEGETVYNDYVFSKRIYADGGTLQKFHLPRKAKLTFADISKKLEKEIAERPADPISQAGFEAQMQVLQEQQERQKQEMEAERAKAAFEALSPEEQTALMQQRAQQEQMAQQATQQQAMAEQQAAMQQATPEELAMAQQAQMQADGTQAMVGQEAPMMAYGGKVNRFDIGGEIMKMLRAHTWSDFIKWAKENKAFDDSSEENSSFWDGVDGPDKVDWKVMLENENFRKALSKDNPALAHALENKYDFGAYRPSDTSGFKYDWDNFWKPVNEYSKQKGNADNKYRIDKTYKGDIKELENSDKYKKFTDYILNNASDEERLNYFKWIDDNTGRSNKYIKDGKLREDWKKAYEDARNDHLYGIQHYTPESIASKRGAQVKNYVINDDGKVEEIYGNVPTDWTAADNYSWATPENDLTYNYYRRPAPAAPEEAKTSEQKAAEEESGIVPRRRWEGLRYAGLFGPAVGLGMQALGIGRPDTSGIDTAINGAGDVTLADYQPIGNYLTYNPMDIWYEQNALNAQSRATDRALTNSVSPSKAAGILANGYNSQLANGNLYRQALEYNDAKKQKVEEFNRGTDMFNADAYNKNQQFNADVYNRARQANAHLKLQAAAQKADMDAGWYNGLYGNVAGLFKGIGDIGRENVATNWRNALTTAGAFGAMDEDTLVKMGISKYKNGKKSSKGGKIKKGKRGLTI